MITAAYPQRVHAINQALDRMVETVRGAQVASCLAFDREGIPPRLATSH
ncbi:hypothetical protein [Thiocystis minor]|nr:hypothetical protein [Thiocystis minor]